MKSCKDITLLIEKSKDKKLSLREKWQVKMHTKICRFCENYNVDSHFLDGLLKKLTPKVLRLSEEEKMKLTTGVKERLN
jgi:hypothetical protein